MTIMKNVAELKNIPQYSILKIVEKDQYVVASHICVHNVITKSQLSIENNSPRLYYYCLASSDEAELFQDGFMTNKNEFLFLVIQKCMAYTEYQPIELIWKAPWGYKMNIFTNKVSCSFLCDIQKEKIELYQDDKGWALVNPFVLEDNMDEFLAPSYYMNIRYLEN